MRAQNVGKKTTATKKEGVAQIVEDTIIDAFYAGYNGLKEALKFPIFKLYEEVFVKIVRRFHFGTSLIRILGMLGES